MIYEKQYMTRTEAQDIIGKQSDYVSGDFYRMQFATSIALVVLDRSSQILLDVATHGSEAAIASLQIAIDSGMVESINTEHQGEEISYFDITLDSEGEPVSGPPQSHFAMQIAYPQLYHEYFGEVIFDQNHPKVIKLHEQCNQCIDRKDFNSANDYFGQHEIPSDSPKKGRPKAAPKVINVKYQKWTDACSAYKIELSAAWTVYLDTCTNRKKVEIEAKVWREAEMERLRGELADVGVKYKTGMAQFDQKVIEAKAIHGALKATGKPSRALFE